MTLHEISKIAKEGNTVKRKVWLMRELLWPPDFSEQISIGASIADDWEIVKKKVKKIGWINIWSANNGHRSAGKVYSSPGEAHTCGVGSINTIQIEWEEEE